MKSSDKMRLSGCRYIQQADDVAFRKPQSPESVEEAIGSEGETDDESACAARISIDF